MKFTITLNYKNGDEFNDIEIEAPDANTALDTAISFLYNTTGKESDDVSSFVIVGSRD